MSKLLMDFLIPFAFVNLILAVLGVYDFFLFPIYRTVANHLHRPAQFYIDHILDQQTRLPRFGSMGCRSACQR